MGSWRHLQRQGRTGQADLIWKIAREPRAVWVGRFTRPRFHFKVRRIIDSAKAQGAVPVIAVLRAESTQCSPSYTAGGRPRTGACGPGTEISRARSVVTAW